MVDTGRATGREPGRPINIRLFEGLMFVSVLLGAARLWTGRGIAGDGGMAHGAWLTVLCLVLTVVLTLAVSRGRSNLAKWLLILLFVLCLLAMAGLDPSGLGLLAILELVAELIALILLFTRPAVAYFDHKPTSV